MDCRRVCDDAFDVELGARVEQYARGTDKGANRAPAVAEQVQLLKQAPTLAVRTIAKVVVIEHKEIERDDRDIASTR